MERASIRKQDLALHYRNEGSSAWLPEFRDGRFVRFMNQNGPTVPAEAPWGPMRVVYLQYASDPIVLFDYRDAPRGVCTGRMVS